MRKVYLDNTETTWVSGKVEQHVDQGYGLLGQHYNLFKLSEILLKYCFVVLNTKYSAEIIYYNTIYCIMVFLLISTKRLFLVYYH